jgi:single-strand DNA-binding protein
MARTLNKVQLIGRLGADPETRYTQAGMQVTTFSLATNRQWVGKDGEAQEETEWHSVVTWDKLAQICSEYLVKGALVFIEGRLHTRSWETDGHKQYRTEVVASDMLMLDSRSERDRLSESTATNGNGRSPEAARDSHDSAPARRTAQRKPTAVLEDDPEDLPF